MPYEMNNYPALRPVKAVDGPEVANPQPEYTAPSPPQRPVLHCFGIVGQPAQSVESLLSYSSVQFSEVVLRRDREFYLIRHQDRPSL